MRRGVGLLVGALVLLTMYLAPGRAAAACHWTSVQTLVGGKVVITSKKVCAPTSAPTVSHSSISAGQTATSVACAGAALALHTPVSSVCPGSAHPAVGQPGPGLIAAAVWRLRLPASALHIQPVKGRTLVNLRTNFYAVNTPIQRTITLLGHRIGIRIWASRYHWRFGDGAARATGSAGAPYPDLLVTHRYLRRGLVRPSLSTTYVAEYRIGGGAWLPVAGSANIAGPAQRLEVVTATPRLTNPYE